MYKFSIIIPSYNITKFADRFFKSLECINDDVDIIFINDKSTDETGEVIKNFIKNKKNARLFEHKKNKGPGGAVNTGIHNMKSDWYFRIDPDDVILPNFQKEVEKVISDDVMIVRYKFFFRTEEGDVFKPSILERLYYKMSFGWSCGINIKNFGKPVFKEKYKMEDMEMFGRQYKKNGYKEKFINEFLVNYTVNRKSSIMNNISGEALENWKESRDVMMKNKDFTSLRIKLYMLNVNRKIKKHEKLQNKK